MLHGTAAGNENGKKQFYSHFQGLPRKKLTTGVVKGQSGEWENSPDAHNTASLCRLGCVCCKHWLTALMTESRFIRERKTFLHYRDAVANDGSFSNYDTCPVIQQNSPTELGCRMDIYSKYL